MMRGVAQLWSGLRRQTTGLIGFVIFFLVCIVSLFSDWIIGTPQPGKLEDVYLGPSAEHWLGTDSQGQDLLELVILGGKDVVLVGLISATLSVIIAVAFGALAAYRGGIADSATIQVTDFVLAIPQFPLLIILSIYISFGNTFSLAILLGLLSWPTLLRAVRAQVKSLKEREYVEAARLGDRRGAAIVLTEILPNMASYLMINFIFAMTGAVYALAGLYILGLAPVSGVNWGTMINLAWSSGAMFNQSAMPSIIVPLVAIAVLQLSAIWFVRSLEEILDPRLRTEV